MGDLLKGRISLDECLDKGALLHIVELPQVQVLVKDLDLVGERVTFRLSVLLQLVQSVVLLKSLCLCFALGFFSGLSRLFFLFFFLFLGFECGLFFFRELWWLRLGCILRLVGGSWLGLGLSGFLSGCWLLLALLRRFSLAFLDLWLLLLLLGLFLLLLWLFCFFLTISVSFLLLFRFTFLICLSFLFLLAFDFVSFFAFLLLFLLRSLFLFGCCLFLFILLLFLLLCRAFFVRFLFTFHLLLWLLSVSLRVLFFTGLGLLWLLLFVGFSLFRSISFGRLGVAFALRHIVLGFVLLVFGLFFIILCFRLIRFAGTCCCFVLSCRPLGRGSCIRLGFLGWFFFLLRLGGLLHQYLGIGDLCWRNRWTKLLPVVKRSDQEGEVRALRVDVRIHYVAGAGLALNGICNSLSRRHLFFLRPVLLLRIGTFFLLLVLFLHDLVLGLVRQSRAFRCFLLGSLLLFLLLGLLLDLW